MSTTLNVILAATDFSALGNQAVLRAATLAARENARLALLHVLPQFGSGELWHALSEFFHSREVDFTQAQARVHALAELTALAERLQQAHGHGLNISVHIDEGKPAQVIAHHLAETQADLLCLGNHGLEGFRELLMGSTSQKLLRLARCSVLLVKKTSPDMAYERVFMPLDFSPTSRSALDFVDRHFPEKEKCLSHAFQLPYEGQFFYARVDDDALTPYLEREKERLEAHMTRFLDECGLSGPTWQQACSLVHGHAPLRLLHEARRFEADLIVMPASAKTDLEQLFLGSVSLHIVQQADCDVLLIKPFGH